MLNNSISNMSYLEELYSLSSMKSLQTMMLNNSIIDPNYDMVMNVDLGSLAEKYCFCDIYAGNHCKSNSA